MYENAVKIERDKIYDYGDTVPYADVTEFVRQKFDISHYDELDIHIQHKLKYKGVTYFSSKFKIAWDLIEVPKIHGDEIRVIVPIRPVELKLNEISFDKLVSKSQRDAKFKCFNSFIELKTWVLKSLRNFEDVVTDEFSDDDFTFLVSLDKKQTAELSRVVELGDLSRFTDDQNFVWENFCNRLTDNITNITINLKKSKYTTSLFFKTGMFDIHIEDASFKIGTTFGEQTVKLHNIVNFNVVCDNDNILI